MRSEKLKMIIYHFQFILNPLKKKSKANSVWFRSIHIDENQKII